MHTSPSRGFALGIAIVLGACQGAQLATTERVTPGELATPELVVIAQSDDGPPGSDAAPRFQLAFRSSSSGEERAIEGEALAYAPFRSGVALIEANAQRPLVLVTPDGARSVLARHAGAPPVRGADGTLYYVARYGREVEVHALQVEGQDRVLAQGLGEAGLLAPRADGSLVFVGARNGGVAGIWHATANAVRCLTNCTLEAGRPWPNHELVPGTREALLSAFERTQPIVTPSTNDALRGKP